jgi:hypothetical protein
MRRTLITLVLVAFLGACGNDKNNKTTTGPSGTPGSIAVFTITAVPVLVPGVSSADPAYQWQISWLLTIQETAGIAATLTEVDAVIDNSIIKFGAAALAAQSTSGSNQVAAKGTLQLNQSIAYTFQNGSRLATVTIVTFFTDAGGNRIIKSTQVRIV